VRFRTWYLLMIEQVHPLTMLLQGFAGQALGYFTVVGLLFLGVWHWGEPRFIGARIQARKRVDLRQIAFEIRHTVIVLLIGACTAVAISLLYAGGYTRLTGDASSIGWPVIAATFVALIVVNDAWFYFWHRLLHHPILFRYVHSVHHKSLDVNPFSSYSFHWIEGFILGAWVLPVVLLVPIYLPMLGVLQGIGLANNLMSHLGYEFLPRSLLRMPLLRWMNTATFHNLHHTAFNGNYGLMFRFWDRMLGTELDHYEQKFLERGATAADAGQEACRKQG
jgi:sterol desaturase/sphingolipid hydroxylase (fatty acid hydroxylase superfamily)